MGIHMKKVRNCGIFLVLLMVSLWCINQVLVPKYILGNSTWPTTSSYRQFYEMERDSIDVLFFGASVAVNSFSPQEIYNAYGIRSYNLGSEQQSVFLSYFWLKEALRYQNPKLVVLDTLFLFNMAGEPDNTPEGLTRKCLDPMKWSQVKQEAVDELCALDPAQSKLSYYLTNIRFHTRWQSLSEEDFSRPEYSVSELKGYAPIADYGAESYDPYVFGGDGQTQEEPNATMRLYLDKMAELCGQNQIQFVLVTVPGEPMSDARNNTVEAYAKEKGLDYYNLCEKSLYEKIGAALPRESALYHSNFWGAQKISRYIGELLKDKYHIEQHEDAQYENTKPYYEHIGRACELPHITDMDVYLRTLKDPLFTVFLSVYDEGTQGLTETVKAELADLGLTTDFTDKFRWSYYAIIDADRPVKEAISQELLTDSGTIRKGRTRYAITSGGADAGAASSIQINDTEYSKSQRGMNIVVYDNSMMKVVDSVCFDTDAGCEATREGRE